MYSEKEVRQALVKARKLVQAGWCKGDFSMFIRGKQHFCALGAIRKAASDGYSLKIIPECENALVGVLKERRSCYPYTNIAGYNDAPGTRKAQVISLFNKAITNLKAK